MIRKTVRKVLLKEVERISPDAGVLLRKLTMEEEPLLN
jgi:hypothetical protein